MQADNVFSSSLAILLLEQFYATLRGRHGIMGAAPVVLTWDVRAAIGLGVAQCFAPEMHATAPVGT